MTYTVNVSPFRGRYFETLDCAAFHRRLVAQSRDLTYRAVGCGTVKAMVFAARDLRRWCGTLFSLPR